MKIIEGTGSDGEPIRYAEMQEVEDLLDNIDSLVENVVDDLFYGGAKRGLNREDFIDALDVDLRHEPRVDGAILCFGPDFDDPAIKHVLKVGRRIHKELRELAA